MAEKPRFRRGTVLAKNLGFGVGFGYRNNTTRNPLKFAGVPQTTGSVSAAIGPKFTILWGHVEGPTKSRPDAAWSRLDAIWISREWNQCKTITKRAMRCYVLQFIVV